MSTLIGRRRMVTETQLWDGRWASGGGGGAVSDSQGRIKGDGSQGDGGRKRQVGGLKGTNGSTATAVRS